METVDLKLCVECDEGKYLYYKLHAISSVSIAFSSV